MNISEDVLYIILRYESLSFKSSVLATKLGITNSQIKSFIKTIKIADFFELFTGIINEIRSYDRGGKIQFYRRGGEQLGLTTIISAEYLRFDPQKCPMFTIDLTDGDEVPSFEDRVQNLFDIDERRYIIRDKIRNILLIDQPENWLLHNNSYVVSGLFSHVIHHILKKRAIQMGERPDLDIDIDWKAKNPSENFIPIKMIFLFPAASDHKIIHFVIGDQEFFIAIKSKSESHLSTSALYFPKEFAAIHLLLRILTELGLKIKPDTSEKPFWKVI